jgi:L-amino acid N-acyltransferase YncA
MVIFKMDIREATENDNLDLQLLQAKCPQGTTVIVSTVNTPDFFARAKVYEDYKVYVATEEDRIIGSTACGTRDATVNNQIIKVGHGFQTFVDPKFRGRRIAGQLNQVRENYLRQQGAALAYTIVMEGNTPSMRYIARQGFKHHRTLIMPSIMLYKEMDIKKNGKIRPIVSGDLAAVSDLINETWQGYELYEPLTADSLSKLIARTPAYGYENIVVLEENGQILACLGFWDWSQVTQITVKALSFKMRAISFLLNAARIFRPIPQGPKVGDVLKQMVLTPIGFKEREHLTVLLRHVNNYAFDKGIQQIFCLCERGHSLLSSMKGFLHVDTLMHLNVKPLREDVSLTEQPVFINGLDL